MEGELQVEPVRIGRAHDRRVVVVERGEGPDQRAVHGQVGGLAEGVLGTVRSVIFGGIVTLGVVGVTAWKIPPLRKLDELD